MSYEDWKIEWPNVSPRPSTYLYHQHSGEWLVENFIAKFYFVLNFAFYPKIVCHPISFITSTQKTCWPKSDLSQVSWINCNAFVIGFAGSDNWNSWSRVTTKRRPAAMSSSRLDIPFKIGAFTNETDVKSSNGNADGDEDENRSSQAAAIRTIGWRQRVPEDEGILSRIDTTWSASDVIKSFGSCGTDKRANSWLDISSPFLTKPGGKLPATAARFCRISGKTR